MVLLTVGAPTDSVTVHHMITGVAAVTLGVRLGAVGKKEGESV